MQKVGVIELPNSGVFVFILMKKKDGSIRFCIDYHFKRSHKKRLLYFVSFVSGDTLDM